LQERPALARHDHPVRRPERRHGRDRGEAHRAPPSPRVRRAHEPAGGRPPCPGDPRHPRHLNTHKPKRDQWGAWRGATPRSR
jgi:hypothetical protein